MEPKKTPGRQINIEGKRIALKASYYPTSEYATRFSNQTTRTYRKAGT